MEALHWAIVGQISTCPTAALCPQTHWCVEVWWVVSVLCLVRPCHFLFGRSFPLPHCTSNTAFYKLFSVLLLIVYMYLKWYNWFLLCRIFVQALAEKIKMSFQAKNATRKKVHSRIYMKLDSLQSTKLDQKVTIWSCIRSDQQAWCVPLHPNLVGIAPTHWSKCQGWQSHDMFCLASISLCSKLTLLVLSSFFHYLSPLKYWYTDM